MAFLRTGKIHHQGGSYRLRMPMEWIREQKIQNKSEVDMIFTDSGVVILFPPKDISIQQMEEVVRDLKQISKARELLRTPRTLEMIRDI